MPIRAVLPQRCTNALEMNDKNQIRRDKKVHVNDHSDETEYTTKEDIDNKKSTSNIGKGTKKENKPISQYD